MVVSLILNGQFATVWTILELTVKKRLEKVYVPSPIFNQFMDKQTNLISKNLGLRLLVDAEYTYMNPGISAIALGMMLAFNKVKDI